MPDVQDFRIRVGEGTRGPLQSFALSFVLNPPLYPYLVLHLHVAKSLFFQVSFFHNVNLLSSTPVGSQQMCGVPQPYKWTFCQSPVSAWWLTTACLHITWIFNLPTLSRLCGVDQLTPQGVPYGDPWDCPFLCSAPSRCHSKLPDMSF